MAGGRASARRRAVVAAVTTLILLASVSFLLSATATSSAAANSPASRLAVVQRHAEDHAAVLAAYTAHASHLSALSASQTDAFLSISSRLSALASRLSVSTVGALEKEVKAQVKRARSLAGAAKEVFDTQSKTQKLSDTVFAVGQQLLRARRAGVLNARIDAWSTPKAKSLHCLAMRLLEARLANASAVPDNPPVSPPQFADPSLHHYTIFSSNVLAVAVVVASAARRALTPRLPRGHRTHVPVGIPRLVSDHVALLDYLRFYLLKMFPVLRRVVLLEDDVVVQRDLAGLWRVDMGAVVNAALHTCFGGFRWYSKYP